MASVDTSLRSAGWVSLWSFGQLVVQFGFQVVLAKYFGASADMDAYVAAMAVPVVASAILVGSLGYAFVPVFTEQWNTGNHEAAWNTANGVLTVLLAVTGTLATLVFLAARPLTATLYPGFSSAQSSKAAELVALLAWLVVTNGLIAYSQAVHHCHKRFILPAVAPVVGTSVTLAGAIVFRQHGIIAIAGAVLAGSVVAAALQAAFPLGRFRFRLRWDEPARRCFRLMLPLVFGAAYYRLDPLVDRHLASRLATGSIAHLGYASRLVTALLLVSTSGLAVVAFPNFSARYSEQGREGLREEVAHAVRCLCIILIPIVVALVIYSRPLIRDLFQRGEFSATDTREVAMLLAIYLGMVAAAGYGEIAAKVFYALSDTRTPTVIGCAGFTVGVLLKCALVSVAGVAGIAAATSAYYVLNSVIMGRLLARRLGRGAFAGVAGSAGRALAGSAAAAIAAFPIVHSQLPMGALLGGVAGGGVYVAALLVQRDEIALRLVTYLKSMFHRRW